MKKSKKYISIIIPLAIFLFVGLVSIPDLVSSDMNKDECVEYCYENGTEYCCSYGGGGIDGTGDTGDNTTTDGITTDGITTGGTTTGTTTKTVSDSITVNVEDPGNDDDDDDDDDDESPMCSQKTYQCEKGTATNKKTTEGPNQFVYIWNCELDGETKGCADPMPTCGDFSYNDGSNWTGGCDGGYTAEKKYDKESNTYTWQCRGSLGDPIQECSYKPKDGQCKYIEDYYPRSGSYDPRKIFLCEGEGVKSINHRVDNEKEIVYWDCPGEEGGKTDNCSKLIYASAICGDEPGECFKGVFVEGSLNYWSDETVQSWKCQGVNGGTPDGLYKNISTCYPDDDGGDDNGGDIIIDGQCADKLGECLSGEKTSVTTDEKGNSYWQCLGSEKGETDYCFLEGPGEPNYPPVFPPVKDPIDGVCGSSNGLFFAKEPASNLCEQGELSGKVLKQENNSWAWTCAGLYGGENTKCETMSFNLTPKLSGCYVGQDQSSCQTEEPFGWLVSGIYNLLSLVTNKSEMALESGSGQKNLEIGYPFSDIKLKVDGGEVASSRAWAVCDTGLYWDSESETCLKPKVCPGEPDYPEPKTPYWTYEYGECNIPAGEDEGKLTVTGICQNYDEGHCQEADGTDYPRMTKNKTYSCFLNPSQPSTISVSLDAKRLDGVDINEGAPLTARSFIVKWNAVVNPTHKFLRCENIKVRESGSSEIKYTIDTGGLVSGHKEQNHPGTPGKLELSLTCYDKNGKEDTAEKTVYFDRITGSQTEY